MTDTAIRLTRDAAMIGLAKSGVETDKIYEIVGTWFPTLTEQSQQIKDHLAEDIKSAQASEVPLPKKRFSRRRLPFYTAGLYLVRLREWAEGLPSGTAVTPSYVARLNGWSRHKESLASLDVSLSRLSCMSRTKYGFQRRIMTAVA